MIHEWHSTGIHVHVTTLHTSKLKVYPYIFFCRYLQSLENRVNIMLSLDNKHIIVFAREGKTYKIKEFCLIIKLSFKKIKDSYGTLNGIAHNYTNQLIMRITSLVQNMYYMYIVYVTIDISL